MTTLDLIAWLTFITAGFSYINHRFLKFPTSIGLMAIALVFSMILLALGELKWIPGLEDSARELLQSIDFNQLVLHGILGALLFAGSLHINPGRSGKGKMDHHPAGLCRCGAVDDHCCRIDVLCTELAGHRHPFHLLPVVWDADLSDRPHRSAGHLKKRWRPQGPGNENLPANPCSTMVWRW